MPKSGRFTIRPYWLAAGMILLLITYLTWRNLQPGDENKASQAAASQPAATAVPATRAERIRQREAAARGVRGIAPSLSASEEVADLVGNEALGDEEVIAGLRKIATEPSRPIDERIEALDHMFNLVGNDQAEPLLALSADGSQPVEIVELILAEALNRPDRLQGEMLLRLLSHAQGRMREEVIEDLEALVGVEHGEGPVDWGAAVSNLENH